MDEYIRNTKLNQGVVTQFQNCNATTGTLMTFDELKQMARSPKDTAKLETLLITSTDAPGKTKEVILKHNRMALSWIDIDSGDHSLNEVVNVCETHGLSEVVIYSTATAKREKNGVQQGRRWRVVICLADSLNCEHWLILQAALARIFQGGAEAVRIQQGFFAPTNPDGGYYEFQIIDGNPLDPANLPAPLLECVNQIVQEDHALKEAATRAPEKSRDVSGNAGTVIDMVNAAYPLESVMSCAYIEKGRNKFLYRNSTSGTPGVIILDGGKRMFSHHQSDPACDGFSHDAFDVLCFHQFNGDISKAVAHFAGELDRKANQERRLEYVKTQSILTPSPCPETAPQANLVSLFIDGNSLLSVPAKKEYLIRDVIEANSTILMFGPSGGGKTFVSDDMGFSCSCGLQWNGHDVKQGLVIVFNGEGFGGKPRRIKAWSKAKGITDLSNYIISKQTVNFETDVQHIILEIESIIASKGLSPVLLIIDTLARHLFGDENSAKDVMKFLKIVESIRCNFSGCSVMIVTHTGNDENNLHRARGSSATKAAVEIELSINKGIITFTKTKDSELPKPIEFKLEQVEIGTDEETGEIINSCIPVYGERSERNKSKEFTRIESVAIRALVEVATKEKRNANGKYIGSTKAWREHFYNIRLAEDSETTPEALKKGFQRTVTALKDKEALEQLSTDSILIMEEHQERINGAITAGNILNNQSGGQETLWGH